MKREIKTTLALDGEKKFKQELQNASRQLRVLGSEMKANTAAFKGNEDSLEALTSRGNIYRKQVEQQKEIVAALARAVEESAQKYGDADRRTDEYRIKLNNATAALSRMESELKQNSQAITEFGNNADKSLDNFKNSLQNTGDRLKGIGQSMSVAFTAPLVGGFFAVTQGTKELRGDLAVLETNAQIAGQNMGILNDALVKLQAVTGETDSNIEGLSELLATGFRDEQLTQLLDSLYGAAIKFKDTMKFEGISDGLQETLATGAAVGPFAELLERSGIALDGFNDGLTEAIAKGTQEQYVLDVLAKTGLAKTYEAYRKNNEEMVKAEEANFRMQQSMAKLGASLEPLLTPIINKITELVNKFNEADPATQKIILTIGGVAAAAGPTLVAVGSMATGFSSVVGIAGKLVPKLKIFAVGMGPVGIAIAAVTTAGVLLYKNWDTISAKAGELKDNTVAKFEEIKTAITNKVNLAKTNATAAIDGTKAMFSAKITEIQSGVNNKFEAIRSGITNKIDAAKDSVGRAINEMKGFFNFNWSLPKIKLPHFNISGSFSLNPPRVPSFGVNWYAKGGIFDEPSIIGVGEAGKEVVAPVDKLVDIIRNAFKGERAAVVGGGDVIVQQMIVRNDNDITRIARQLFYLQQGKTRGLGLK
ncbi:hypothetical protein Dred_2598 [Desulforamulus reducens MI-1]|uniref:Uncharacterized protein n=1 Tax=Desulforamulus reducens (strain ATCC BAA-1160 / DSM 100696 / MI-1) TaxID=349161 RepID=A4J7Q5_DESRM|nr:hypothetical protein [Desulforamulus reducens]ABO51108.1 hypothetical protein Dred_2598 [Desulforamulus reducens MI-1]